MTCQKKTQNEGGVESVLMHKICTDCSVLICLYFTFPHLLIPLLQAPAKFKHWGKSETETNGYFLKLWDFQWTLVRNIIS